MDTSAEAPNSWASSAAAPAGSGNSDHRFGCADESPVLVFLIDAVSVSPAKLRILPGVLVEKLHQYLRLSHMTHTTQRIGSVLVPLPEDSGCRSPAAPSPSPSPAAADDGDCCDTSIWGACVPCPVAAGESTTMLRKALRLENRHENLLVLVTNDQAVAHEVREAGKRGMRVFVISAVEHDSPLATAAAWFVPIADIITDFDMVEESDYAGDAAALSLSSGGALVVRGPGQPAVSAFSSGVEMVVSSTAHSGTVALAHGSQLVTRCRENVPLAIAAVSTALVAVFTALRESPQVNQIVCAARDLFGVAADNAVERCSGILTAAPSCARFRPLEPVSEGLSAAVEWLVRLLAEPVA